MTSRERVLAADRLRIDAGDLGRTFNRLESDWYDNILPDVPPQNIVAMYEAVDEYR